MFVLRSNFLEPAAGKTRQPLRLWKRSLGKDGKDLESLPVKLDAVHQPKKVSASLSTFLKGCSMCHNM